MKLKLILSLVILLKVAISCGQEPATSTGLTGPYLGQTPPGKVFKRFAPNLVPEDMFHSVTVSPDGQEIYWAINGKIMFTRQLNGSWTTPAVISFSGRYDDDAPVVSPDNRKLFFNSLRPYGGVAANTRYSFWYAERSASGWSEPKPLPEIINSTGGTHWQVSIANSGTVYFGINPGNREGIYYSQLVDGEYTHPEPLTVLNNLGEMIACPFIAPDESYIIFNKINDGGVSIEYYVSFRSPDNKWLTPKRLSGFPGGQSSFVTRDGKYIFCNAYWASAQIIEDLRTGMADMGTLNNNLKVYPNPANGSVTLSLLNNEPKNTDLTISNLNGQVLYAKNIESVLSYSERIDISGFDAGLYLVKACKSVFKLIVVSGF